MFFLSNTEKFPNQKENPPPHKKASNDFFFYLYTSIRRKEGITPGTTPKRIIHKYKGDKNWFHFFPVVSILPSVYYGVAWLDVTTRHVSVSVRFLYDHVDKGFMENEQKKVNPSLCMSFYTEKKGCNNILLGFHTVRNVVVWDKQYCWSIQNFGLVQLSDSFGFVII